MTAFAYYNEIDDFAASWLEELIKAKLIADGVVDRRSITEVEADDLDGFTQCHFFAGIGGWSYALRLAGWSDDREVWTGSCPCQPFSAAGKQEGFDDDRHLWPVWANLIAIRRPPVLFGEQVEAAIGHGWIDLVQDDLEDQGYAFAAVGLPGPCVGAFDIRQRLWFVAESDSRECGSRRTGSERENCRGAYGESQRSSNACKLADTDGQRRTRESVLLREEADRRQPATDLSEVAGGGAVGFWSDCDWLPCADGKARPVEPGTQPLAHGVPARVGRLRGYGNAIKPQVAEAFIRAYLTCY